MLNPLKKVTCERSIGICGGVGYVHTPTYTLPAPCGYFFSALIRFLFEDSRSPEQYPIDPKSELAPIGNRPLWIVFGYNVVAMDPAVDETALPKSHWSWKPLLRGGQTKVQHPRESNGVRI